jgi:hypothetical protein
MVLLYFKDKRTLLKMMLGLVAEAEEKFGNGTGTIKYSYVVSQIYGRAPPFLKMFLTEKMIDTLIETAVNELQAKLEELLGDNGLEPADPPEKI